MVAQMDSLTKERYEFVPQAILGLAPSFFANKWGISFQSHFDDLNAFRVAELMVGDTPFALLRYEGTPPDETEVYLPDNLPRSDVPVVISRILTEFELPTASLRWMRERYDTPY